MHINHKTKKLLNYICSKFYLGKKSATCFCRRYAGGAPKASYERFLDFGELRNVSEVRQKGRKQSRDTHRALNPRRLGVLCKVRDWKLTTKTHEETEGSKSSSRSYTEFTSCNV